MGFVMAAPVGPVGILCIRRTLRSGWRAGLTTGLGVAVVDSFFGLIACLGSTSVSEFLGREQHWIREIGGIVLLFVGWLIFRSRPALTEEKKKEKLGRNFISAFFLALTNPLTILSFAAVYFSLNLGSIVGAQILRIAIFVVGVFFGSCLWWALLSRLALYWKKGLTPKRMTLMNRICGIVIALFGVFSALGFLYDKN